jgi:hypothetical protein
MMARWLMALVYDVAGSTISLDQIPLFAFFVVVLTVQLLSVVAGFAQGKRGHVKSAGESEEPVGAMVSAVFALLAFMLAFTFSIAASRFDERRLVIVEEANAIGTTFLRTDFLTGPEQAKMKTLLRNYVLLRIKAVSEPETMTSSITRSEQLQSEMWAIAVDLGRKQPTPISALFVASLNDTIDLQTKRVAAGIYSRVPQTIWSALLLVSVLAFAGVGYYNGRNGTRAVAQTLILVCTYSIVLLLVADLDRPNQGLLRSNQQPMLDLARQIEAL